MRVGRGIIVVLALLLVAAAPARAEQVDVTSFDGTKISAQFTPADGLKPGEEAPVMLMTHGFGATRETVESGLAAVGQIGASTFREHGYSTLTWDSRGFGRSGGEIALDDPKVDGRDVSALLDYLATRDDVQLDKPGDPRAGIHGASYGGAIEWANAINDHRIDALAPAISFIDLPQALARDGRVKVGWGAGLLGLGEASGLAVGLPELETGAFPPDLLTLATTSAVSGQASPEFTDYLASRDTEGKLGRVTAPSLILQGTADTLFPPTQAIAMWGELNVPKKMLWFCGGHGACLTGNALDQREQEAVLDWMDRYVKRDKSVKTGPAFEWVADDNVVRTADGYPLASAGELTASGKGSLVLAPGATASGLAIAATPAAQAVEVPIPAPKTPADVAAEPKLTLRYSGTAQPAGTHVFAQLVDKDRNLAVGNQVTPIPVTLDGKPHEISRSLEGVAMHITPDSHYVLQVIGDTTVYGLSQTAGTIDVQRAAITLPLGDSAATKAGDAKKTAGGTGRAGRKHRCRSRRKVRITVPRGARHVRVRVAGKRVRTRRASRHRVKISLVGKRKGRYRVAIRGRRKSGKMFKIMRRYRTCTPNHHG